MDKLFIHIPKTGGTAIGGLEQVRVVNTSMCSKDIQKRLRKACIEPGLETRALPLHFRYKDLVDGVKASYDLFSIIRNPWNRLASRYNYSNTMGLVQTYDSFDSFLEDRSIYLNKDMYWQAVARGWYSQLEYVTNNSGLVSCDIIRFEHLEHDMRKYLNMPMSAQMPYATSYTTNPTALYTSRTIQLVADWYKDEIDYFGFDFDTSAQKNTWFTGKSS